MNALLKPAGPRIPYGIHANLPPADYYPRRLNEASASGLKQMLRSPAHFHEWVTNPDADKTSPALEFGKVLHCAVLEPEVFAREYVVEPKDAPSYPAARSWAAPKSSPDVERAKDFWREWEAEHKGMTRVSVADYDKVRRMADSAMSHPVARGLLVGGQREVTFSWQDEETGIDSKSRVDLSAPGEFLMDLKTCRDASPEGFARAVASYGYALQADHYLRGAQANGAPVRHFLFLCIEVESPFICQPYVLDVRAEEHGRVMREKAIQRQAECLRTRHWPAYSDALLELALPTWAYYQESDLA